MFHTVIPRLKHFIKTAELYPIQTQKRGLGRMSLWVVLGNWEDYFTTKSVS